MIPHNSSGCILSMFSQHMSFSSLLNMVHQLVSSAFFLKMCPLHVSPTCFLSTFLQHFPSTCVPCFLAMFSQQVCSACFPVLFPYHVPLKFHVSSAWSLEFFLYMSSCFLRCVLYVTQKCSLCVLSMHVPFTCYLSTICFPCMFPWHTWNFSR